jgi:acyl-coenzyme A synthetase/AMP-(fatty) acid ligase
VERVLEEHPAVAEAGVVGVETGDDQTGAAFVVLIQVGR